MVQQRAFQYRYAPRIDGGQFVDIQTLDEALTARKEPSAAATNGPLLAEWRPRHWAFGRYGVTRMPGSGPFAGRASGKTACSVDPAGQMH